jgi:S-layer domain protein
MKKHTLLQRLLPLAMLAAMLLSAVPAAAAFRDTAGHWAEKTLDEWQDEGLIDGYGDGSFQPNGTMTRAEFAKLVNRTMGFTAESEISFSDVTERDWFHAEVARAVAAGYAQGSGGLFRPNQPVTRAEAATMLARAAGLAANEERADAFADAASIPTWARGSVGAAAEAGYMTGYPNGAFGALGSITRAEAVVTLDRVRRSAQKTVIEQAGTTLKNETVLGDLVIAESVGEGNVTLKNVTVLGSVIVKGGGANSVYFDGVRVGGAVRLEKEGVHLRLRGDTALERVEIGLPCRITRDSTFEGALGALVIDLAKESAKEIQIEVPAKRVELLSRTNVALNADVETLRIDRDAEGAQLDIKRGVMVGELSIDARVALTGSGLVVSLVVSVSGVTVSGSLTVEKTGTEDGAKAPTTSGGSYVPVKIVTGAAAVPDVAVDYGTSEADAMGRLPGTVTLNVTENGTAGTVEAAVRWALDRAYSEDPRMDTVYTATGTVTIPDGCTYDGTLTVTASLTVTANPENVVVGILEVAGLELPYGAQESDVQLPAQVTVKIKNGHTERADVRWTLDGEWTSPGVNTFTGTVSMPPLQYYNGEMNADIKTTVTVVADGATPKTKAVVDFVPLALTSIGYMRAETLVLEAARQRLPADVLLRCEDDSYIEVVVRPDDLEFTKLPYAPTPGENQTVSFTGNAALPAGYAYAGGTSPVRCHLEVKALDTAALNGALAAAKTQLDTLTEDESVALADSEKIFVAANGVTADSVTKGVKFIERSQTATLKDAYAAAQSKNNSDTFASQAECDQTAQELQEASDAFAAIVPNVGTLYTNAMILEAVKNGGAVNPQYSSEFAYSAEMQPLRKDYTYCLYGSSWTVPGSNVTVSIDWSVSGDGAQYLAFAPEGGHDHKTICTATA